jgi:hypothetical protein
MSNVSQNLSQKGLDRLAHVVNDLKGFTYRDERIKLLQDRIVSMQSNFYALFLSLQGYSEAKGISTWFYEDNLSSLKNWFYNYGKLAYICAHEPYNTIGQSLAYENRALEGMYYLISDHEGLITWYSGLDAIFDQKGVENTKSFEFYTKQFFLALRGEWDTLGERCERIIANPPSQSREKKFMPDHHFYLALSKGDVVGMEQVISELVSPKMMTRRESVEGGYTAGLLCTPAIIYSKLAWRHGYEIVIDSPYIPQEWLPIKPLEVYEDAFELMEQYQITGN